MDEKRLGTLQNLQRELQTIQPTDPLVKDRIDRLNGELNRVIDNPNQTNVEEYQTLQDSIQETIEDFEEQHPNLTEALRIAINTLVNAGI